MSSAGPVFLKGVQAHAWRAREQSGLQGGGVSVSAGTIQSSFVPASLFAPWADAKVDVAPEAEESSAPDAATSYTEVCFCLVILFAIEHVHVWLVPEIKCADRPPRCAGTDGRPRVSSSSWAADTRSIPQLVAASTGSQPTSLSNRARASYHSAQPSRPLGLPCSLSLIHISEPTRPY